MTKTKSTNKKMATNATAGSSSSNNNNNDAPNLPAQVKLVHGKKSGHHKKAGDVAYSIVIIVAKVFGKQNCNGRHQY